MLKKCSSCVQLVRVSSLRNDLLQNPYFKDKNETFEHLEKSHKETGRRCHHCFDFFSFDIDAMKNHIHENHRQEFKMTRGNVKSVKKRTAKIQKNGKLKCDRCKVSTITSAVTLEKHYYRY